MATIRGVGVYRCRDTDGDGCQDSVDEDDHAGDGRCRARERQKQGAAVGRRSISDSQLTGD